MGHYFLDTQYVHLYVFGNLGENRKQFFSYLYLSF